MDWFSLTAKQAQLNILDEKVGSFRETIILSSI
uniref:Uncharacterized protein n=1 Tax=Tetranychus urticae TaxID=32264 RepID=T1K4M0_TETUR